MTADYPRVDLPRDQIRSLLAEHRDPDNDHLITLRPGGGWLIITASHVLPDGTMDECASTQDCLGMHGQDLEQQ